MLVRRARWEEERRDECTVQCSAVGSIGTEYYVLVNYYVVRTSAVQHKMQLYSGVFIGRCQRTRWTDVPVAVLRRVNK